MDNPQTKKCTKCGEVKGLGEYHKNKGGKHGLRGMCKMCDAKYHQEYYIANRIRCRRAGDKYYKNNKTRVIKQQKKYRLENPDKARKIYQRYSNANPEIRRENARRRRARKANAPGSFTYQEWQRSVFHYAPDGRCLCCGEVEVLTRDHVIPITKGGSDSIDNIQPLCQSCNSSKHTKSTDYRPDGGAWARQQLVMEFI